MGLLKYLRTQWDRTGAVLAAIVGLVALLLGWVGTSGTPHIAKQLPYIMSGGLIGIFFLGVGGVLWISADLRDEWRELRSIGGQLHDVQATQQSLLALETAAAEKAGVAPAVRAPEVTSNATSTSNGRNGRVTATSKARPARTTSA